GHVVRRLEDGDEVVLPERPVGFLQRRAGLLGHRRDGIRPFRGVLDIANALIGEISQHDECGIAVSSLISGFKVSAISAAGPPCGVAPGPFSQLRQASPSAAAASAGVGAVVNWGPRRIRPVPSVSPLAGATKQKVEMNVVKAITLKVISALLFAVMSALVR